MLSALTLQDPIFVHANLVTRGMESRAMVIIQTFLFLSAHENSNIDIGAL